MNRTESSAPTNFRADRRAQGRMPLLRGRRMSTRQKPDATLVVDETGCVMECNQSALTLFGKSDHELLGMPLAELIPTLPLSTDTPGYNMAYGAFHSANHQWLHHVALAANGLCKPIHIHFNQLVREGRHLLVLSLTPPPQATPQPCTPAQRRQRQSEPST